MSERENDPAAPTTNPQPGVVSLPSAGVPADHGLSSLGLLMQLAGDVFAAGVAMFAFFSIFTLGGGLVRTQIGWIFLVVGMCIARSMLHRMAGTELLYGRSPFLDGTPRSPLGGVKRYILAALVQTLLFCAIVKVKFGASTKLTIGLALGLAAWPLVLAALLRTSVFVRFDLEKQIPVSEDKGFEAASILMTVLGVCGALTTSLILVALFEAGGSELMREGRMILVVLGLVMLVVRSCLHVQAGVSGLRETSVDRAVELANRYANFGVITSFCVGGALLLAIMTTSPNVLALAFIAGICWMLMAWPLAIRRFFGDRQFSELLAGDQAAVHRRAPDAGLTGLGWLLLGHAVFSAAFLLPELVAGTGVRGDAARLFDMFGSSGLRSPWWNAGIVMLQGWAGYELIRMMPHHRIIATLYAAASCVVTIYLFWPILKVLELSAMGGMDQAAVMMPIAIALVLPVSTLVLVNRAIAPTARARFRPRSHP